MIFSFSKRKMRITFLSQSTQASQFGFAICPFRLFIAYKITAFHCLTHHFNRWYRIYTSRFGRCMTQYSGDQFQFYPILVRISCSCPSYHMRVHRPPQRYRRTSRMDTAAVRSESAQNRSDLPVLREEERPDKSSGVGRRRIPSPVQEGR